MSSLLAAWPTVLLVGVSLSIVASWGCNSKPEGSKPDTAERALQALIRAYQEADHSSLYELCSRKTKNQFISAFKGLVELRGLIEQDYPLGDREQAMKLAAVDLLDGDVETPRDLFAKVVRLDRLDVDSGVIYGATPKISAVDEDKGLARFTTLAGDSLRFEREDDGIWRSRHLESIMEERLAVLNSNLKTARAYHLELERHRKSVEAQLQKRRQQQKRNHRLR